MRTAQNTLVILVVLMLATVTALPQNAAQAEQAQIPVKVTVVFKEYQSGSLVDNLPYVLSVNAVRHFEWGPFGDQVSLRMGLNVPVSFGSHIEYRDVGTNIDCGVKIQGGGQYLVRIAVSRNSVHHVARADGGASSRAKAVAGAPAQSLFPGSAVGDSPIFDKSSMNGNLLMRDGQTIQPLMATDPVTGRVLKVDVTLNVVR